ncbi:tetraspanin-9-like [Neocloeon triangulifer]|uniref:tetraspanin-9-like n=1 Tax=Neocloeon triangulifer TaxID=2078957 RepID=UPI00286EE628|nr:tetraspanin-9-like [Neocloeon triangulifer]
MAVKLNCAESTIKYILFFLNCLILLGGIALVVLGSITIVYVTTYDAFLSDPYSAPAIVVVTSGALIVLAGLIGCFGAAKQSYIVLLIYAGCLCVIFLLQFVGGILVFTFQEELGDIFRNTLEDQMRLYDDPENGDMSKLTWDTLQSDFKCCGIDTFSDWKEFAGMDLPPDSCKCDGTNLDVCNSAGYFKKGCYFELKNYFTTFQNALGAVAVVFAVDELIAIVFAIIMAFSIKRRLDDEPAFVTNVASRKFSDEDT